MEAAIDMFTEATAEISKAEQIYQEAINATTDEDDYSYKTIFVQMICKSISQQYKHSTNH